MAFLDLITKDIAIIFKASQEMNDIQEHAMGKEYCISCKNMNRGKKLEVSTQAVG